MVVYTRLPFGTGVRVFKLANHRGHQSGGPSYKQGNYCVHCVLGLIEWYENWIHDKLCRVVCYRKDTLIIVRDTRHSHCFVENITCDVNLFLCQLHHGSALDNVYIHNIHTIINVSLAPASYTQLYLKQCYMDLFPTPVIHPHSQRGTVLLWLGPVSRIISMG